MPSNTVSPQYQDSLTSALANHQCIVLEEQVRCQARVYHVPHSIVGGGVADAAQATVHMEGVKAMSLSNS